MLGHLVACAGYHEARRGGDVEGVFAVATGTDNVYVSLVVQRCCHSRFENTVAEAQQLVHTDTAHLQASEQGGDLFVGILTASDAQQYLLSFLASELFVVQDSV